MSGNFCFSINCRTISILVLAMNSQNPLEPGSYVLNKKCKQKKVVYWIKLGELQLNIKLTFVLLVASLHFHGFQNSEF